MQQFLHGHGLFLRRFAGFCLLWLACWAPSLQAATYTNASTPYSWINPAGHTKVSYNTAPYKFNNCGTNVPILDDTISDVIPIGWNFLFGATSYNSIRIESNGRVQFNNAACTNGTQNIGPPQTYTYTYPLAAVVNTMKPFGVDLDPTSLADVPNYPAAASKTTCTSIATCYVSYASIGVAPNRQFVISWVNVPEWVTASKTSGSFTFQVILNEDGSFVYQYNTIVHGGTGQAQIGWELTTADYDVLTFGASTEPGPSTAILFYIPSGSPLAEYRFEEGAWAPSGAGQVTDSSVKLLHGMALGSTQETPSGKVCRGASIPLNTTAAAVDAIKTGVRFSDAGVNMTGQGTAMFWYNSNLAWNSGQAAQLLDATLTNGQWFYLTKTPTGTLYFQVTDSTGALRSVETPVQAFAANTWVHIAISWNFNASPTANSDHLQIFVEGGAPTTSAFTSAGTLAALDYVYAGDNPSGFTGTKGTVNSANGTIDELRFYNSELNQGQVLGARSQTHACNTFVIDHLELRPASWSGLACAPGTMVVAACANATVGPACTPYTGGLVATLSSTGAATVWDTSTGGATITIGYGQSSANKTFYTATGTSTMNATGTGLPVAIPNPTKCIVGGAAGSCNWTSANGGLLFTVPNSSVITGGQPTSVSVQAVQSPPTPGAACVPVQNLSAVGLKIWTTATSPAAFAATSSSAGVTVGGAPQVSNASAGPYAYTPQSVPASNNVAGLNFDGTATSAFWLKHMDTGQFVLNATLDVAATASTPALTLTGTSGVTSVPVGYGVTAATVQATAAAQAACAAFPSASCDTAAGGNVRVASAGGSFSSTVIAALWTVNADTDLTDNPVAPSYAGTVNLSPTLVAPTGGAAGAMTSTTAVLAAGTNTNATQSWTQSGAMKISASGTYFGQPVTGQSAVMGRFSPKNFKTALTTPGCGAFTYSGQPITTVTITAMDGAAMTAATPNYTGAFARAVNLTDGSASPAGTFTTNPPIAAAAFVAGVATGSPVYTFTNKETAPISLTLRAADGEITSSGFTEAVALIRSGRIRLSNAYGSELLNSGLPLTTVVEYYDTAPTGWRSGTDTCTNLVAANFAFATAAPSCTTGVSSCITALSVTATGVGPYKSPWTVNLAKPTAGGSMCVTLNLDGSAAGKQCTAAGAAGPVATSVAAPWLKYGWTSATPSNPAASVVFGIFKSPLIYQRENY
jgi:MSHA biogenesis protein MshQ